MSEPKRILILYLDGKESIAARDLAEALTRMGASVIVRECDAQHEQIIDAVAVADTVVCWH
jgi:hypothetical protein